MVHLLKVFCKDFPPMRFVSPDALADAAAVTLTAQQIEQLRRFGSEHTTTSGELLYEAGKTIPSMIVVLEGRLDIVDRLDGSDRRLLSVGPGQFVGELSLLTGQVSFGTCVVAEPGRVLTVPVAGVRRVIATLPALGDVLVMTFALRRKRLLQAANNMLTLVGPDTSQSLLRVAEFADRNRLPYRWLLADDPIASDLLDRVAADRDVEDWVIVRDEVALPNPSPLRVAKVIGLDLALSEHEVADLLVVGAGPAGLSAAVYAASEGLRTIVVDNVAIGGQAGASSRIENYLGFPTGISGGDLAFLAEVQALKFGARITVPNNAVALRRDGDHLEVELEYGNALRGRCVMLATGARYRRLGLPGEDTLAGIYYAATELEARFCSADPVVVVGGGNSAGQAAMFLSERTPAVHLVHRGDELQSSMSQYLIARLEKAPNIHLHFESQVVEIHGHEELAGVTIAGRSGHRTELSAGGLFVMIGADPCTAWLRGAVELDRHGFILTGDDLPRSAAGTAISGFETSQPGVYAVGDVRSGSIKRVASAVGEGSVVVAAVHRYLASTPVTIANR
jgi:thioredoxin reductase (NADPH)